jgi:ABC-type multidrug transport system fused ATPase/permease subunit
LADRLPEGAALPEQVGFGTAFRQLYGLLSQARRRQFYRLLSIMLLGATAELVLVASAVPFLAVLAGNAQADPFGPLDRLLAVAGLNPDQLIGTVAPIFIIAVLAASAIRLLLSWSNQSFVLGVGHDLAVEAQRRILLQPYAFHVERSTSESIAALEKIQILVFGVLQQAMTTIIAAIMGLVIMALLISIDASAALAAVAVLGLAYWLISRITAARLARNSQMVGTAYDQRVQVIQESLGGIRDLIIDQTQGLYLEEFRKVDHRVARARVATTFIAGSPRFLLEGAGLIFVAALAIALSGRDGGLGRALPVLGAIALGGLRLMPMIQQAFASWATLAANRSVVGQVLDLLALPIPDQRDAPAQLPFRSSVVLADVSYAYPTRSSPAIDRVSLEIQRGEHLGIAGETGSGKSTLADLIMGLLPPQSGSIAVDGVALGPGNVGAWRQNIAHVSQSIFLADASIARNIAFSVAEERLDMARVRKAAAEAEIAGFVETLPNGYETMVGERGVRLSGGQRQRIAIARALYKGAPLLVLDEATNALDPETEEKVLANVFADDGRTVLIIAHRPSAMKHCDRMIHLGAGRIISEP